MTKSVDFHPMRGDVYEGNQIIFSSGRLLTVKSYESGWRLRSNEGLFIGGHFENATDLTSWIAKDLY